MICEKQNITKVFKRKNGNTNGMKNHLQKQHIKFYNEMFPVLEKAIKKDLPNKQKVLEDCFKNVSI